MGLQRKCSKKQDIQPILTQFAKAPQETSSKTFYQKQLICSISIKVNVLEEVVGMVFRYQKKSDQKCDQNVSTIIEMLKSGGGFAQYLADHPEFDKSIIFSFLQNSQVDEGILSVFGQIFVTLARSNPAKVMQILKNEDIQNILIRNLKRNQVTIIIYTAIFCLNEAESTNYKKFISGVFRVLLSAPFEDIYGNSLLIHCTCYDGSNGTKQDEAFEHNMKEKKRAKEKDEKYQSFCSKDCLNNDHPFFNLNDADFYQEIITATSNLADMFEEISNNINVIYIGNVEILIDLILENCYLKDLFTFLVQNQKQGRASKPELSSQIWRLVYGILIVTRTWSLKRCKLRDVQEDLDFKPLKKIRKHSISEILQCQQNEMQAMENKNKQTYTDDDHNKLFRICHSITHYMQLCYQQYIELKQSKKNESSLGAKIERVGLSKYNILKIHLEMLEIIEHTQFDMQKKYSLKVALPSLLPLMKECMRASKWNNITINLIVKVIKMYIKVCYGSFRTYAVNIDKISEGFLGFLIQNFRNKYHIFLNSMKFCPQGDHYSIYLMSKQISTQLHSNRDLIWLFTKFPEWKTFMENDLQQYEHVCMNKNYYDESMLHPVSAKLIKSISLVQSDSIDMLERGSSVQEINEFYRQNWDWFGQNKHVKLKTKNFEAPTSVEERSSYHYENFHSL